MFSRKPLRIVVLTAAAALTATAQTERAVIQVDGMHCPL